MLKKTLTWEDFNGVKHTEDFYFHLTKLEIAELQLKLEVWHKNLLEAAKTNNLPVLVETYKEIIRMAAGVRSEDGANFIKTPEAKKTIMESQAIEELVWTFLVSPNAGIEFLTALMPKEVQDKFREDVTSSPELASIMGNTVAKDDRPAWEKEGRNPTPAEFAKMTPDQQKAAFAKVLGAK